MSHVYSLLEFLVQKAPGGDAYLVDLAARRRVGGGDSAVGGGMASRDFGGLKRNSSAAVPALPSRGGGGGAVAAAAAAAATIAAAAAAEHASDTAGVGSGEGGPSVRPASRRPARSVKFAGDAGSDAEGGGGGADPLTFSEGLLGAGGASASAVPSTAPFASASADTAGSSLGGAADAAVGGGAPPLPPPSSFESATPASSDEGGGGVNSAAADDSSAGVGGASAVLMDPEAIYQALHSEFSTADDSWVQAALEGGGASGDPVVVRVRARHDEYRAACSTRRQLAEQRTKRAELDAAREAQRGPILERHTTETADADRQASEISRALEAIQRKREERARGGGAGGGEGAEDESTLSVREQREEELLARKRDLLEKRVAASERDFELDLTRVDSEYSSGVRRCEVREREIHTAFTNKINAIRAAVKDLAASVRGRSPSSPDSALSTSPLYVNTGDASLPIATGGAGLPTATDAALSPATQA